jgi:hypothetical protein
MFHLPPGVSGLLVGTGLFLVIGICARVKTEPGQFIMDPERNLAHLSHF